jgi:hypothetical protein
VAFLAGLGFSPFVGIKSMGRVTAVAFVLDVMASFTKCLFQRFRKSPVLWMFFHSFPGDGMPAFLELFKFFLVALTTYLGFNCRFFCFSLFVAFMTGNTIDLIFGMFTVDPGLENSTCLLLMTGQTIPYLLLCPNIERRKEKE